MSTPLKHLLILTDAGFILYWLAASAMALGWLALSPEAMYANYDNPQVVAWNWSFLPLDIVFSCVGLGAVRAAKRGDPRWQPLALISLVLTMTAGGMAVAYWGLLGEYDPAWFVPNLLLLLWPVPFLPRLIQVCASHPIH